MPAASRSARARQRAQRALTIGSPLLAAAAVTAVIATSAALSGGGGGGRTARPATPTVPLAVPGSDGWARLPRAPIAPRNEYAAVWTGKQMIVWGGYSNNTQYGDGAAYDPATRTWTKLAAGPLAGMDLPVAVWTGKDMLIFGGSGTSGASSDGAAYDPAANTWRKLAPIPASLGGNLTGSGSYAVWTGKVMVAWGFFGHGGGGHGGGSLAAATYDPAANTWTTGTVAPAQAPLFGDAFWTGKEMIVWGYDSPGRLLGLGYNPATKKWSVLPVSPLGHAGRDSMLAVWTGRYLVVGGGDGQAGIQKDAAAYDPATNHWTRLPDAPVGFEGNGTGPDIWTGASRHHDRRRSRRWPPAQPGPHHKKLVPRAEGAGARPARSPRILDRVKSAHLGWRCLCRQLLLQGRQAGIQLHAVGPPPIPFTRNPPRTCGPRCRRCPGPWSG